MPQPNNDPFIKSKDFPYPIRKNANGGFDIILRPALTQGAITDAPAPVASDQLPPPMADEGGFVGNMPRPRPENGPPMPQAPAADAAAEGGGGVGDMMNDIFTGRGGESTTGTHDGMPPDMGGILPGGWKESLASMVGGMQNIDRNQSPLAALASGMGGAMTTRENRRKDKRAEMLSDEDRAIRLKELEYQHGRDTRQDTREDRRDTWAEDANKRAEDAAEREGRTFLMTEALTGQKAKVTELEMQKAKIELDRAAKSQGLTAKESADLYGNAVQSANALFKDKYMEDEGVAEAYRKTIDDNFHAMLAAAGVGGGGAPAGPQGSGGTGAQATPISWAPGSAPRNDAEFKTQMDAAVAANGGQPVWYTNPSNGKILPYTGNAAAGAPR